MADIDEILSSVGETAPAAEPVKEKEEAQPTQVAEETPAETSEETDAKEQGGMVPVAALQAERTKARKYTETLAEVERKLAEQNSRVEQLTAFLLASQQKQPSAETVQPPDFWEAPENAIDYRLNQAVTPIQQALKEQQENVSRILAAEKHGEEAINEAYSALASLKGTPQFDANYRQIMSSPHPYGALVDWHQKHKVMSEIGSDPVAFREKIKAEIFAEMKANGGAPASMPAAMPSNFATARNVGSRSGPSWSGPTPIADIFAKR